MMNLDEIEAELLKNVANIDGVPEGAYNFRVNGKSIGRKSSKNINVEPRETVDGLKITIAPNTNAEAVHIPVIISKSGYAETVYNDFYIGENANVTIIAGCGIYNCGTDDSIHDGIHRFYVGKNAKVKYIEKHYGAGPSKGKILNPTTEVFLEEGSYAELEMEQIKGVDSTIRTTKAELKKGSQILINERLFTEGRQEATSKYDVTMEEDNTSTNIISRSVATDFSRQIFKSNIIGAAKCKGHSECDAILMDKGSVLALPALDARNLDAELIHEAAIGKIAGEQITKLMTLGLNQQQAESQIVNGFLK
ncbi:SufD family Fe-S cluster assembly protein [Candidatus Saccharibacteria bacterium]|nr:SufD family Fe-S cluster assembly protein [Candidatus Saccharibacteria bacterium]